MVLELRAEVVSVILNFTHAATCNLQRVKKSRMIYLWYFVILFVSFWFGYNWNKYICTYVAGIETYTYGMEL